MATVLSETGFPSNTTNTECAPHSSRDHNAAPLRGSITSVDLSSHVQQVANILLRGLSRALLKA
jgi:hypothetical protein